MAKEDFGITVRFIPTFENPVSERLKTNVVARIRGAKLVTSTVGGGLTNTAGGVVGAANRGIGETISGITGGPGVNIGKTIANVGNGIEDGTQKLAKTTKNVGEWKRDHGLIMFRFFNPLQCA